MIRLPYLSKATYSVEGIEVVFIKKSNGLHF